jgi:hypothetical protein
MVNLQISRHWSYYGIAPMFVGVSQGRPKDGYGRWCKIPVVEGESKMAANR